MPPPPTTAASSVPSADEAMEVQPALGALDCVQVAPLLVEVQIPPLTGPDGWATAASRVPSAEAAMALHCCVPFVVCVQFDPAAPGIEATKPGRVRVVLVGGRYV